MTKLLKISMAKSKFFNVAIVLAAFLSLSSAAVPASAARKTKSKATKISGVHVDKLLAENMENPLGLNTRVPRFSWQTRSSVNGTRQTAYRILVASDPSLLKEGKADLWDTGTVSSDEQLWIPYGGTRLKDNQRAFWTVRVVTDKGVSPWAEPRSFSVGLLGETQWNGRWIGIDHLCDGESMGFKTRVGARYLRTEIELEQKKEIRRATAYVAALGLYELYVNGKKQGDDVLAPSQTDTRKSVIYNTLDITDALKTGNMQPKACVGITLGNGRTVPMRYDKHWKTPFLGFPKCRIEIVVEYADGKESRFFSSEKWKATADGPIRSNNEYDGEVYDARKTLAGWATVGFDDSRWRNADRTDIPSGELCGQPAPNMKVLSVISPKEVRKTENGTFIVDFGQNMAGWVKMNMTGNRGDSIKIKYAEKLDGEGKLFVANLRDAETEDTYVCAGDEKGRAWHPTFVYHGFRYVEVKGMKTLTAADLEAQVVSDFMERSGRFMTSNEVLNGVYRNAEWGILSNYKGFPVDCPQRNERQPWLGDRVAGSLGESFIFNNERLYSKWMRDICESQRSDGVLSDVAPAFWRYYNDDVTWPSALPFGCDMLYTQYGNAEPAIDSYPAMKKWVKHVVDEYLEDGIVTTDKYGDWCVPPESLELIHSKDSARQTDGRLISTAYMIKDVRLMKKFAKLAGQDADTLWYASLEREMTGALNRNFLHIKRGTSVRHDHVLYPDSVFYGNNTATANLLPLALGIVPDDCRDDVARNVAKNILTVNGGHVPCGVIGISWLMRGLSDNGFADIAYLLATNDTYPSWGYMKKSGATTIWELWNGDKANPWMNSGNHVMLLGDLLTWCYEYLGGLRNADGAVAYKRVALRPSFEIEDLDSVDMSYDTPYGKLVSKWKKNLEHLDWDVEIPVGVTADVCLPGGETRTVGSGKYSFECDYSFLDKRVVKDEFVYKQTDFPQCHASSIVELDNGDLVATYFGGTKERNPDVCIWVNRKPKGSDRWSEPILVADGVFALGTRNADIAGMDTTCAKAEDGPIVGKNRTWAESKKSNVATGLYRKACWNPVLFQMPDGELWLFFKIGWVMNDWTGWVVKSKDGGKSWSEKEPLPEGFLGPIKNKPVVVGNRLICPSSTENEGGWKFHFEILDLSTGKWKYVGPIERELRPLTIDMNPDGSLITGDTIEHKLNPIYCIQPSILKLSDGRLQAIGRTKNGKLASTYSSDNGDSWTKVTLIDVPNNQSGTDAVTLRDGRHVLIYNDFATIPGTPKGPRNPLSIAVSNDGLKWKHMITLEDSPIGDYSYPAIIQAKDGTLHCVYTWRRFRIVHKQIKI